MGARFAVLEGPAMALSVAIREAGAPLLAAQLSELLPDPSSSSIGGDSHRSALTERLRRVAGATELPEPIRAEADRLVAVAEDLPTAMGRIGRAWIAWVESAPAAGPGWYWLSWQSGAEGDNDLYEDGPSTPSIEEAIAWGRRRTHFVLLRPEWDPGRYYWAGLGEGPAEFPVLAERR